MTPKKPDWFELTENNDAYAGIQKVNKKLPIATLALAGAVILGGSLFATANNELAAVAETPTASQSVAASQSFAASVPSPRVTTSQVNSLSVPTVTNAPQHSDDGQDEGRERGDSEHENRDDD